MALLISYPAQVDYTPLQNAVDRLYVKSQPSLGTSMLKTTGDSLGKLGSSIELYNANQEKQKNEELAQKKYTTYMDNWSNMVLNDTTGKYTENQVNQAKAWLDSQEVK
jgi:Fe-S cluster assembly iron-binding protein IscA